MDQNLDATLVVSSRAAANRKKFSALMAAMIAFGFVGCGGGDNFKPELGLVTGTVTINGTPAPGLVVTFEPQMKSGGGKQTVVVGSASAATTDAQGRFELFYAGTNPKNAKGAVVGPHLVRIQGGGVEGPAGGSEAIPLVVIPEQYNTSTTLKADVKAGDNPPQNFDLQIPK